MNECACGCGEIVLRTWVKGHNKRRFAERLATHRLGKQQGPISGKKYGPIYGPGHFAALGAKTKRRHRRGPQKAGNTMKVKALVKKLTEA